MPWAYNEVQWCQHTPVAKAQIANATKMASAPQPVEKIVVSNLLPDVNEAQVKVR